MTGKVSTTIGKTPSLEAVLDDLETSRRGLDAMRAARYSRWCTRDLRTSWRFKALCFADNVMRLGPFHRAVCSLICASSQKMGNRILGYRFRYGSSGRYFYPVLDPVGGYFDPQVGLRQEPYASPIMALMIDLIPRLDQLCPNIREKMLALSEDRIPAKAVRILVNHYVFPEDLGESREVVLALPFMVASWAGYFLLCMLEDAAPSDIERLRRFFEETESGSFNGVLNSWLSRTARVLPRFKSIDWPEGLPRPDARNSKYVQRANSIFLDACVFKICRDIGHSALGDFNHDPEKEYDVDEYAFDLMLKDIPSKTEREKALAGIVYFFSELMADSGDCFSHRCPSVTSRLMNLIQRAGLPENHRLWLLPSLADLVSGTDLRLSFPPSGNIPSAERIGERATSLKDLFYKTFAEGREELRRANRLVE